MSAEVRDLANSVAAPQRVRLSIADEANATAETRPTESPDTCDNRYPALHVGDLCRRVFPKRKMLLGPWLPERSLSMIFGARGVGKSYLTLSIAVAISGGREFLGWAATGKQSVLYVDGEMAADHLQTRVKQLGGAEASELPLHFIARDLYHDAMPTLDDPHLRGSIEWAIKTNNVKLMVLDNLSTLWSGRENEAEAWDDMQRWLLDLRSKGVSVLIVHHANKGGDQRGSSRKEDALDVVIALRRPESTDPSAGAEFNVQFTKSRSAFGSATQSFHAKLGAIDEKELAGWERSKARHESQLDTMLAMKENGETQRAMAKKLNLSESTVSRMLDKYNESVDSAAMVDDPSE